MLAAIRTYEDQIKDRVQGAEAEMPPSMFWSDGRDEVPYFQLIQVDRVGHF